MEVKKKITRHGHDYVTEEEYVREARVGPECGNSNADKLPATVFVDGGRAAKMKFICLQCGCQWEVRAYRGKEKPGTSERGKIVECTKGKWLDVMYPSSDDKPEYRLPILCRAQDIGKIIYGNWIIGGEQCGHFQYDSYSDEAERFYTAYKLVKGVGIDCNFPLDAADVPFITMIAWTTDESRADAFWDYEINDHVDSYCPRREPDYVARNGIQYMVMPKGQEE